MSLYQTINFTLTTEAAQLQSTVTEQAIRATCQNQCRNASDRKDGGGRGGQGGANSEDVNTDVNSDEEIV